MKNEEKHISFGHLMAAIRATNHKGEGIPFSISFITADKRRNIGGELLTIPNAVFLPNYLNASKEIRRLAMPKSPKHYQHSTLNLFNLDTLRRNAAHCENPYTPYPLFQLPKSHLLIVFPFLCKTLKHISS